MIPAEVRAVVFDAMGTLIVPHPPVADTYAATGQRFGSRVSRDTVLQRFRLAFQHEESVDNVAGLRTSEDRERERWRRIVNHVLDDVTDREGCFLELFNHFGRGEAWRCPEDAANVLGRLNDRGYRLGIGSNWDSRLRTVLRSKPELRLLSQVIISSEVGWRKPSGRFYQAVAEAFGLAPRQILFVGDDPINDYGGARLAGMQAVLLDPHTPAPKPTRPSIPRLSALLG